MIQVSWTQIQRQGSQLPGKYFNCNFGMFTDVFLIIFSRCFFITFSRWYRKRKVKVFDCFYTQQEELPRVSSIEAPMTDQSLLGHKETRTQQVSWVDPSRGVRTQEDCRPIANNSSVVECLCKEREVVDEETGQLTALRVEKAQWVSRSGGHTRATTICRLSTYLSWMPPSPASACRSSGSPAAAWDSDQDVSVSSLETNSSFLP